MSKAPARKPAAAAADPSAKKPAPACPPIVVIVGDDDFAKYDALKSAIDRLLPTGVDRGLALVEYDASTARPQRADDDAAFTGGPDIAAVFDDLQTLPFLADRRVVVIREADRFITAHRAKLEKYAGRPAPTGTLVLVCRSFPATTKLHKVVSAIGGEITLFKRLTGRALIEFVLERGRVVGKQLDYPVAARLVELIGPEQGTLANEVEKLALFALDRAAITDDDVSELVGQSREERVFAAMDAAALGRLPDALAIWSQTLATDKAAAFKAVGGVAWVLRRWLTAHEMRAGGMSVGAIAPRVSMWGRERELETILRKLPQRRVKQLLAFLADLDAEAKVGARSIERGIEALLVELAA